MVYFVLMLGAAVVAAGITPLVRRFARRFQVLDLPLGGRKIHKEPMPLLGGLAPWCAVVLMMGGIILFAPQFISKIPSAHLWGLFLGSLALMIGGYLDDRYRLRPSRQILFPLAAALIVIMSGIGIREITNPFGGVIPLVWWEHVVMAWGGQERYISLPADLLTFGWLLAMMYTTKALDGLDGLVSGMTVIGGAMILFLTTATQWYQPEVGTLAALVTGAFLGFLIWNFHPAKIFLGEGGSTVAGFFLGTLAVISGGKIATALLVFGIPMLDLVWVVLRRTFWDRTSVAKDDRKHLHFRLLDVGFTHRGAVLVLYAVAALFGILTLVLQSREKLVALGILVSLMVIGAIILVKLHKNRNLTNRH
ncbi:MAG: MraY family glycosyltransferase [bacterium]|nr:MraY family glycosyltransferase [bacterium]